MIKLKHAAALVFLFWLFLPASTAHAQLPPPVSYLFVEVKDTSGKAVSDATVASVDDSGKEYNGEKTDQDGVLKQRSMRGYGNGRVFNSLRVSKPGYLPSDHLIFFRPAGGSIRNAPGSSRDGSYAVEDFPDGTQDSRNWKPSPIRVTLIKAPLTEAERRAVADEERKRLLLAAVKRGDAATLRTLLLAGGAGPNTSDSKGVSAIAWAAFTGNRDIIHQLLDAGADVKTKKTPAHEALSIYLSEGLWLETNRTSSDESSIARREEVVRKLVEAGADVNAQSPYRGVALIGAISRTPYSGQPVYSLSPGLIKYLIDKGANVNAAGSDGATALMAAALKGSDEITRMVIAAGANVNAKDKAGKTALIYVPQYQDSNPEVVRVLISAGADVNAADNEGRTALMQSAFARSNEIVGLLLDAKASVNTKDKKGMTPLMLAGMTRGAGVAKVLIQAGASVGERDEKGWTALMHAAPRYSNESGAEFVKVLIAAGADVNTSDAAGMTPLMLASHWYDAEVIRSLLAARASINAKDGKGQTALMHAFQSSGPTDVSLFTRAGAAVNERDAKGWTPLLYAAFKYFADEEMKALIGAGADVSAVNDEGQTPLMLAAQAGHAKAVKMLLENGMAGAVNARDKRGRTALMYIRRGYSYDEPGAAVVRVLVAADADVKATDEEGRTALMSAAEAGSTDGVKALVESGASVNAKDKHGRTALMWSVASKDVAKHDAVYYLLQAGADATAQDDEGQTAFTLGKKNGIEERILSLLEAANGAHKM